jgi:hypothetical protein
VSSLSEKGEPGRKRLKWQTGNEAVHAFDSVPSQNPKRRASVLERTSTVPATKWFTITAQTVSGQDAVHIYRSVFNSPVGASGELRKVPRTGGEK